MNPDPEHRFFNKGILTSQRFKKIVDATTLTQKSEWAEVKDIKTDAKKRLFYIEIVGLGSS